MTATLDWVLQRGDPDGTAVVVPGGARVSYAKLREQVQACADALAQAGVRRGDRVALVLPNGLESIVLFLAAASAGSAAPLNPGYKESEFRFYLEDTGARVLVVPRGGAEAARKAAPEKVVLMEASVDGSGRVTLGSIAAGSPRSHDAPGPDDEALVLHTSGTTSRPKQVSLRHRNLAFSA